MAKEACEDNSTCFLTEEKKRIVTFFNKHKPPYVNTEVLEEAQNTILEESNQIGLSMDFDEILELQSSVNQNRNSQLHINMLLKYVYFRNLCNNRFLFIRSETIRKCTHLGDVSKFLYDQEDGTQQKINFKIDLNDSNYNSLELYLPLKAQHMQFWNLEEHIQDIYNKQKVDNNVYTLKNIINACNTFNSCIETIFNNEESKAMFCREMIIKIDDFLVLFLTNSPCLLILFLNAFRLFISKSEIVNYNLFVYSNKVIRKNGINLPYSMFIFKFFEGFIKTLKSLKLEKSNYEDIPLKTLSSMYFFVAILRMFVSGKNDGDSKFQNNFLKHFNQILDKFVELKKTFKFNSASRLSENNTYSTKPLNNIIYFSYYKTILVIMNIKKQLRYPNLEPGYKAALLQILLMLCTGCRYTEMFSSKFLIHSDELNSSFIESLEIVDNDSGVTNSI